MSDHSAPPILSRSRSPTATLPIFLAPLPYETHSRSPSGTSPTHSISEDKYTIAKALLDDSKDVRGKQCRSIKCVAYSGQRIKRGLRENVRFHGAQQPSLRTGSFQQLAEPCPKRTKLETPTTSVWHPPIAGISRAPCDSQCFPPTRSHCLSHHLYKVPFSREKERADVIGELRKGSELS